MALKDNPIQSIIFDNFMLGQVSRVPPERAPKECFTDSQNISLNERYLPMKALGQKIYDGTFSGSGAVRGMAIYTDSGGTKYYVKAEGGYLWYSVAGSGTFTQYTITVNGSVVPLTLSANADVEFAEYNHKLFVVNGKYPVITNDNSNDHQYTTNRMIMITGTAVTNLTVADIPAGLQYLWVDKERMFGANSIAQASGLFWTNAYFDYSTGSEANWTPVSGANYDYVGKDDGEDIAGIHPYQNSMYVLKARNVYRYSTDGDITNWGSIRVDTIHGCAFNRTIKELEGYLIWLSPDGVMQSDGTNVSAIDENIWDKTSKLPQLASTSRQLSFAQKTDMDAGTFGADLIDDSQGGLIQKSQKTIFVNGTFGSKVIQGTADTTQNVRLLAQIIAADWLAGTLANTAVIGNTVQLQTTTYSEVHYLTTQGNIFNGGDWPPFGVFNIYDIGNIALYSITISGYVSFNVWYSDTYSNNPNDAVWHSFGNVNPGQTINTAFHRYWMINMSYQYAMNFNYTAQYNYGRYLTSGSFVTQTLDFGLTPLAMGIFTAIYTVAGGTGLTFATRTSADGTSWDGWVAVIPGGSITSTARRYIQIQANFTSPATSGGATSYTPVLQKIMISSPFQSKILDYALTPDTFGTFAPSQQTPSDSSITWYGRSSANSDMSSPTAWVALTPNAAVPVGVTLNRYFQWYALLNPSTDGTATPEIDDVFVGVEWWSAVEDLGATPLSWGNFSASQLLNGQSISYYMRGAATSGAVSSASWTQQVLGNPVNITLYRYVQVKVLLDTSDASSLPLMEGLNFVWYTGANLVKPCAYVFNKEYGLNITDIGQSINNLLLRYNPSGKTFWLPRTNKYNNVFIVDESILLSGTSQADGYCRLNETGYTDDGVAIKSWFITKNTEQDIYENIFRKYVAKYKAAQDWTLSFSTDSGATWIDFTIYASSSPNLQRESFSGLVSGNFLMVKCEQDSQDSEWEISAVGAEFEPGREKF